MSDWTRIGGPNRPIYPPGGIVGLTLPSNSVWYVDSATGNTDYDGKTWQKPKATVAQVIALTEFAAGDVIMVAEGHAETLATAVTLSDAGICIIGEGEGDRRPAFTVSGTVDGFNVTAADVRLEKVRFVTPSAVATAQINIAAARCVVRECGFAQGANSRDAITITADGELPTIEDCDAIVAANGPDSWIRFEGVVDRPIIRNNVIIGSVGGSEYDDGVIDFNSVTAAAGTSLAVTNPVISYNTFLGNEDATPLTAIANGGNVVGETYGPNIYGGGTTNADTVGMTLADDAITAAKIAANAIGASEIANGAIDAATFAAGAIDAAAIAAGAIDAATFAAGAIDAAAIAAGAIDAATFAAGAIDAAAIGVGAIAADAFAAGAIDAAAIAAGAIDAATFAAGAIDAAAIATDAIDADAIAAGAIAADAFAAGAIDAAAIANGAIDAATFAAGAIDAAAIATDAIDADAIAAGAIAADAFAAGAIDAAAIANGAIDAATFAAGAIDAAAIATDAIDADAIAAGAIAADAFAAGAIDAAAIADNAIDAGALALSAGEKTTDGIVVTRATAALPQTTAVAIFTVTGHCLLRRILGVVTVEVGAVGNVTHLRVNSTGAGATTDICLAAGGLDITGDVVDTMYEIDGTFGNAMIATTNLPKAKSQAVDLVVPPGTIELACAASDGGGGRVRWSATYVPMEAGAQIVAA